jgi:YD repeat-containing protein
MPLRQPHHVRLAATSRYIVYSDGVTPSAQYTYDENRPNYYQNINRLTSMRTHAGGVTQTLMSYDYAAGQVARNIQTVGGNSYELRYSYNLAGQLTSKTYPTGRVVAYNYDTAARPYSIADGSRTYVNNFVYAAHGGLTNETYGNGVAHQLGYNSRLQPNAVTLTKNGGTLQHFAYQDGQVDQATGAVDATKNVGQVARLDSYVGGTADTNRLWQQRFSYDSLR